MKRSARMAAFLLAAALSAAPCLAEFTPVEVPQAKIENVLLLIVVVLII